MAFGDNCYFPFLSLSLSVFIFLLWEIETLPILGSKGIGERSLFRRHKKAWFSSLILILWKRGKGLDNHHQHIIVELVNPIQPTVSSSLALKIRCGAPQPL
jgi:hypothetical protein